MAMISVSCVVDVCEADFDANRLSCVFATLDAVDAVVRLELDDGSALGGPESGASVNWVRGTVPALERWLAAAPRGCNYATLFVDGLTSPAKCLELIEQLFDAGVQTILRSVPPHGATAAAMLARADLPVILESEAEDAAPDGMTGKRARLLRSGAIEGGPATAIWELDPAELLVALDASEAEYFSPATPHTVRLPDGSKLRELVAGGSMAAGHTAALLACQASLGFKAAAQFEDWLASVSEHGADHLPTGMASPSLRRRLDSDGRLTASTLGKSLASAVVLAGELLTGARSHVERHVGLRVCLMGPNGEASGEEFDLGELDDASIAERQVQLADHGLGLLASACGMIAVSPAPLEARLVATQTLAFIGVPDARRVRGWLEARTGHEPHIIACSRRAWSSDPAWRTRELVKSEPGARELTRHLRNQVEHVLAWPTGAK